ncbi:MAG: hypothetical protein GY835_06735 [bacterium]|nr:hypothetical protein [bacterium]
MKQGLSIWVCALILILVPGLFVGCDDIDKGTAPGEYTSITDVVSLTPNIDAGAPVALAIDGNRMAITYSCLFNGTGDIYRLELTDEDGDDLFESFDTEIYYPNINDLSINYLIPAHDQFTQIGAYEVESGGHVYPVYPGTVYFSGPRHLFYDEESDRIFYSMGYSGVAQIASTQCPVDATGGHFGEIINEYDEVLRDFSSGVGRPPIWDFWYTIKEHGDHMAFSGGYCASVSPTITGVDTRWLAYSDTLYTSYDHDGDGERGEDPVGFIEVVDGPASTSDGAPGYLDVDDDNDGEADFEDIQIVAMTFDSPDMNAYNFNVFPADVPDEDRLEYYSWMLQNYNPAFDDDEDGLMDEDLPNIVDDDGDGLFDEDGLDSIDNDDDGLVDEDPIDGSDNDGDGLVDEDPVEDPIDNDGDGRFDEDGPNAFDDDGDGLVDEDARFDMNGDGYPGDMNTDDDDDGFRDGDDPDVIHSTIRANGLLNYDATRDDDEDGISDEDADNAGDGVWVVRVNPDGTPDHDVDNVPIPLTNNGERQPFFNPVDGSDLLYVRDGDIHRLPLTITNDNVEVAGESVNLTESGSLESYPSYSDEGDKIVYCSSLYGSSDVWVMSPDGSNQVQVTNEPGQELFPRFTPGGRQILYEGWLFPAGVRNVMITTGELP